MYSVYIHHLKVSLNSAQIPGFLINFITIIISVFLCIVIVVKVSQACNGHIKKRKTQKSDLNEIIHFTLPLTFRYFQVYIEILHMISPTKNNITVITVIINHSRLASKN